LDLVTSYRERKGRSWHLSPGAVIKEMAMLKAKNKEEITELERNVIRASSDVGALIAKHLDEMQKELNAMGRKLTKFTIATRTLQEQVEPTYGKHMEKEMRDSGC
jgi:predicted translin family RNA/ssDNA-binding protein